MERFQDQPWYALGGDAPFYSSNLPGNIALGEAEEELYYRRMREKPVAFPKLHQDLRDSADSASASTERFNVGPGCRGACIDTLYREIGGRAPEYFVPLQDANLQNIFEQGSGLVPISEVASSLKPKRGAKEHYVPFKDATVADIFRPGSGSVPITITIDSLKNSRTGQRKNKEHLTVTQAFALFHPRPGGSSIEYLDAAGVKAALSNFAVRMGGAGQNMGQKIKQYAATLKLGQVPASIAAMFKKNAGTAGAVPAVVISNPAGAKEYLLPDSKMTTHQGIRLLQTRGSLERFTPNKVLTVNDAYKLFQPKFTERMTGGDVSYLRNQIFSPKPLRPEHLSDPRFLPFTALVHYQVGSDVNDIDRLYGTKDQRINYPKYTDLLRN
jgi:hypothetical protein